MTSVGPGIGTAPRTGIGTGPGVGPAIGVAVRIGNEIAAGHANSDATLGWLPDDKEWDGDRTSSSARPEGISVDEDTAVLRDEPDPTTFPANWARWIWLTITEDADGRLGYQTDLPPSDSPEATRAMLRRQKAWEVTAEGLLNYLGDALRCRTPVEALLKLPVVEVEDDGVWMGGSAGLEHSKGQGSRDRLEPVNTPFGVVPLWFFTAAPLPNQKPLATGKRPYKWNLNQERPYHLLLDLKLLGDGLIAGEVEVAKGAVNLSNKAIEDYFARIEHDPVIWPDSIRSVHGKALLEVARQRRVVAKHRGKWAATDRDSLLDDLGIPRPLKRGVGARSKAVATLALAGAFDESLGIWEG